MNKNIILFFYKTAIGQIHIEISDYDTIYVKPIQYFHSVKYTFRLENHVNGNYSVFLNDYPNVYQSYTVIDHKLQGYYKRYSGKKRHLVKRKK